MSDFLGKISTYSPKRLALLADELRLRVEELERAQHAPVAIVGIGCRFPGGADTPEKYWDLLARGRDAITEVPSDRWAIDEYYDADPDAPGKMSTRWGGFLSRVDGFDPHFFGISPREAQSMDPQQRLLLEVTWEALEHAGLAPDRIAGTRTGVFVGMSAADYFQVLRASGVASYDAYTASGTAHSIASGRVSYVLGAQGPSVSIDTACSSSLVAVHQAFHSVRRGECDVALAGGVNLILAPDISIALSKSHMMAPDGRCKAFDARADGFVRGEGCGILVLKRLADATAAGDRVIAVIRGSASNQDGRSNGLTAPNGPSQEQVIRDALADARVSARDISFVEGHGTGTSLGDPIEVQALASALGEGRTADDAVLVGSVKANIGHLEAAAGAASIIKLALMLQHRGIPGQLHLERPNPFIPWDDRPVRVPTAFAPWKTSEARRMGGVSSFGFSGTNVHVVLEEAPDASAPSTVAGGSAASPRVERPLHIVTASARNERALRELLTRHSRQLASPGAELPNIARAANAGRAHFAQRCAVVAPNAEEAAGLIEGYLTGEYSPRVVAGTAPTRAPKVAFLFTGQGSQRAGMARELYDTQPVFAAALDRCDALLRGRMDRSLLSVVFADDADASLIDETEYTQPACFALGYALATLWMSWGVRPAMVMGHSVGEYVAACIAGVFTLEEGLTLIAERARLMGALPRNGAMAAMMATRERVAEAIKPWSADVAIAAVNAPANTVVSGLATAVAAVEQALAADGISAVRLKVSHGFHSPLVRPMVAEFGAAAATVSYQAPQIDLVSAVTGAIIRDEVARAEYWRDHVLAPVEFAAAMRTLAGAGCDAFVEIGAHPTLLGLGRECLPDHTASWLPSLRRGRRDWDQLLESLSAMYVRGADIDWRAFDAGYERRPVVIASYPFQRERYWADAPSDADAPLPTRVRGMLHEVVWREIPPAAADGVSPPAIAERVRPLSAALARRNGLDGYAEFQAGLDDAVACYIVAAFQEMGRHFDPGERIAAAALARELRVLPKHERLLARMLAILAEENVLAPDDDGWRVQSAPPARDPDALCAALLERFPECEAEVTLTARCGRELAAVLQGRTDPLGLLFPGGSLADTERLYQTSPPARTYNALIGEVITSALPSAPADRPLRVLEIGAGTGSTTASILPHLSDEQTEYTFTDVSPLFLNRAREKFGDRACMRYELLDIGADPAPQGFATGHFDVIVAANVLHATPDLDVTVAHVRSLLAPGGILVLLEGTAPQRFGDLTVGLLDGWWAFSDTHRRAYALLSQPDWTALLGAHDFADTVAIPGADAGPVLAQQAVFVAQAPRAARKAHRWLVVADQGGVGVALAAALQRDGDVVQVVHAADNAALSVALNTAPADGESWSGVVNLTALDEVADDSASPAALAEAEERLVRGTLETVHALTAGAVHPTPALWIVTRGAQPADATGASNPAQATVWGTSHVIAIEHPELRCARIDIDPSADTAATVNELVAELRSGGREDQIALRDGRRLARRLVRAERLPDHGGAPTTLSPDRTYLVTGGLRGLGLRVAEWLAEKGAKHLVLMGRRPAENAALAVLRGLAGRGVHVEQVCGDVSLRPDVERVLAQIADDMPPLGGIVHAAGVLDDGVLASQTWERFETVMAPKVFGSWHLHQLAGPLEFLVLFSSGASVAGSAGQGNHAAANAFEDALAWYRQAHGLPTLSINWGPWAEIGAAVDRQIGSGKVLRPIAPADGLLALDFAMRRVRPRGLFRSAQVAVLSTDWSHLLDANGAARPSPLLGELVADVRRSAATPARPAIVATAEPTLHERIRASVPNRRRAVLRDRVTQLVVRVLGVQHDADFDVNEPLRQMGLDSLMAVELRNALGTAVGRTLPSTITFDHPSVEALVEFLAADVFATEIDGRGAAASRADTTSSSAASPSAASASAASPSAEVATAAALDDLSADELASQLARRLDRMGHQENL